MRSSSARVVERCDVWMRAGRDARASPRKVGRVRAVNGVAKQGVSIFVGDGAAGLVFGEG